MSITNNTTFDHLPNEIRVNRSINFNNNPNTSTISRQKLDSMIYSTGIDSYMFNEIKKAKYQGCFDPGSIGNINMFNDSYNYKITTTETSSNANDLKKTQDKAKKITRTTSTNLYRHDEGKNLLIAKSETQYPYEFDRRHCVLSKRYNFRKNLNPLDYCYSYSHFSPTDKIKRAVDSVKIKKLSHNNSNYNTPGYNDRKYRLQTAENKYNNKTLMINSLMDNYYNSSKVLNNSRFNNSSYNKNSCSNLLSHKKNVCFSPIISTKRYKEYDSKTSNYKYVNKINQKLYKSLNYSKEKNEDNNILFFSQLNDYDYNINSNETEFDNETWNYRRGKELKIYKDIDIHIGNENDNDNDTDNGNDNNMKLINKYMSKIVSLFLTHMSNFYLLHFRDIFKAFISQLKKSLKNDEYHFENKTIKNIALIKKKIKSNPFYYGHNKQFQNLLKEENKKNPNSTNKIKNKINPNIITDIEKQVKINLIRKRYVLDNKKNIDKKRQIKQNQKINSKNNGQKKLQVEIINKKYTKKKVSQRVIDKSRLQKIIGQQKDNIKTNTELFTSDYFTENNQNEMKKLFKSFDENEIINDDEFTSTSNMDKKLITSINFSKVPNSKTKEKTLLFKKTTVPNACKINKNINLKKSKRKVIIPKNNEDKKDLKIYGVSDLLSQDEKLNMNMKYLEIDNNNLPLNTTNNKNNKNFEIDNNFTHTIIGEFKNTGNNDDNNDDENENEIDTFSNRKLQNAISIITKIMESKENNNIKAKENNDEVENKDKDKNKNSDKINSFLKKIIEKKEKKNIEIIKKYFNKFKVNNSINKKSTKKKKKYSLDLGDNIDSNKTKNNLIEFNNQKEDPERNRKERKSLNDIGTSKESTSPNRRGSKFKVVIKKLKIHKSITKNIFNPKIKVRLSKKSIPSLTDINSSTQRSSLNKINSMIINSNKANILNDTNKLKTEKEQKEEKKDEENKSSIESDESSENSNLNINNEISKKNVDTNSDKNLHRNIKIISKKNNNKDKRKSLAIPHKKSSIEMFTKYIKNKAKVNSSNESIHDGDTTLNEKYQDYENLIFYLRTQLIYCFINNKKNNDSCVD